MQARASFLNGNCCRVNLTRISFLTAKRTWWNMASDESAHSDVNDSVGEVKFFSLCTFAIESVSLSGGSGSDYEVTDTKMKKKSMTCIMWSLCETYILGIARSPPKEGSGVVEQLPPRTRKTTHTVAKGMDCIL